MKIHKKLLIMATLSILCICSYLIINFITRGSDTIKENSTDNRILADKYVEVGILDKNKKLIDNGSNISFEGNTTLNHILQINQKDNVLKEYLLIILEDFNQIKFSINGDLVDKYIFALDAIDNIDINIELNLSDTSGELCYLVIPRPNQELTELNLNQQLSLQNVFTTRFKLNNCSKNVEYFNNPESSDSNTIPELFVSNSKDELKIFNEISEKEYIYLTIGNVFSEPLDYAIVSFHDWTQSSIDNTSFIKYVSLKPNTTAIEKIQLPEVNNDTNVQFISFPLPYKVDSKTYLSTSSFASGRFKVNNIK